MPQSCWRGGQPGWHLGVSSVGLISDFWPPELQENNAFMLSYWVCGSFSQQRSDPSAEGVIFLILQGNAELFSKLLSQFPLPPWVNKPSHCFLSLLAPGILRLLMRYSDWWLCSNSLRGFTLRVPNYRWGWAHCPTRTLLEELKGSLWQRWEHRQESGHADKLVTVVGLLNVPYCDQPV